MCRYADIHINIFCIVPIQFTITLKLKVTFLEVSWFFLWILKFQNIFFIFFPRSILAQDSLVYQYQEVKRASRFGVPIFSFKIRWLSPVTSDHTYLLWLATSWVWYSQIFLPLLNASRLLPNYYLGELTILLK